MLWIVFTACTELVRNAQRIQTPAWWSDHTPAADKSSRVVSLCENVANLWCKFAFLPWFVCFVFSLSDHVIFSRVLFSHPSKNSSFIHTRLFENLNARIIKSIIGTWSEMEQQNDQAQNVYCVGLRKIANWNCEPNRNCEPNTSTELQKSLSDFKIQTFCTQLQITHHNTHL